MRMTSKAPSPRSRPSSVAGIVASSAGVMRPSTQASSAVVVVEGWDMAVMIAEARLRLSLQNRKAGSP